MRITYYLEVTSSWCWWCEPMWAELRRRYAGRVAFDWKIAKMAAADFPTNHAQYDWFLRRSAAVMRSAFVPTSAYYEYPIPDGYPAASAVAEAARTLGVVDDRVRTALSAAAYRHGRKVGRLDVAVGIAAAAGGLDAARVRALALSPEIGARLEETTAEFHALQVAQRPTFVLEDEIGDKAVFSGLVKLEPLAATIDAMLADAADYAAYRAQHGDAPA